MCPECEDEMTYDGTEVRKTDAKIVAYVSGGVLTDIYASPVLTRRFDLRAQLHDEDNLKADGLDESSREARLEAAIEGLIRVF
jgi:hypothetical protein